MPSRETVRVSYGFGGQNLLYVLLVYVRLYIGGYSGYSGCSAV